MNKVIELLKSNSLEDKILGVILGADLGFWDTKEVLQGERNISYLDSCLDNCHNNSGYFYIIRYSGRYYCIGSSYIGRYKLSAHNIANGYMKEHSIYNDEETDK